jgi:hypothetical protein
LSDDRPFAHISMDALQVAALKNEMTFGAAYANRISIDLAFQLREHGNLSQISCNVRSEIEDLETGAQTSTKPAKQFKKSSPLGIFWHKHFYTSSNLINNIGIRWGIEPGAGNSDLDKMINSVFEKHSDQPEFMHNLIARNFVMEAIADRTAAGRMTGDWIIFSKHKGQNYYLRLATHKQGRDDAAGLFQMIKNGSCAEFPFLFNN